MGFSIYGIFILLLAFFFGGGGLKSQSSKINLQAVL